MKKIEQIKNFVLNNEEKIKKATLVCAAGIILGSAYQQSRVLFAAKATGTTILMPSFVPYIDMLSKAITGATIISVVATSKITSKGK